MISYEDDGANHFYTIGTFDEILQELGKRVSFEVENMNTSDEWEDYICDICQYAMLMSDIYNNGETNKLIAITPDTLSGNQGWGYVDDIKFDMQQD